MSGGDLISVNNLSSPGVITVDGHDIRDLNPYWLRRHIGTVSQVKKKGFTATAYSFIVTVFIQFQLFSSKRKALKSHLKVTWSLSSSHFSPRSQFSSLALLETT